MLVERPEDRGAAAVALRRLARLSRFPVVASERNGLMAPEGPARLVAAGRLLVSVVPVALPFGTGQRDGAAGQDQAEPTETTLALAVAAGSAVLLLTLLEALESPPQSPAHRLVTQAVEVALIAALGLALPVAVTETLPLAGLLLLPRIAVVEAGETPALLLVVTVAAES